MNLGGVAAATGMKHGVDPMLRFIELAPGSSPNSLAQMARESALGSVSVAPARARSEYALVPCQHNAAMSSLTTPTAPSSDRIHPFGNDMSPRRAEQNSCCAGLSTANYF